MSYTFEKKEDQYALIAEGEYEVTLEAILEATTMSGKKKLDIMFRVRLDVEQSFQKRAIFEAIWQEKDTNFYNRKRLNQLLATQDIKDGTVFNNINEIIDTLKGAKLKVKVIVAYDDYKKADVNKIAYYKKTEQGSKKLAEIKDEDLPF